jgi:hypothetical protein
MRTLRTCGECKNYVHTAAIGWGYCGWRGPVVLASRPGCPRFFPAASEAERSEPPEGSGKEGGERSEAERAARER